MAMRVLIFGVLLVAAFLVGSSVAYYLALEDFKAQQVQATQQTETVGVTASVGTPLEFSTTTEYMQVRWVSDPEEVRYVLDEYWAQTGKLATGLSITINGKCAIYAFEPKYENDRNMQILGHELTHCFRGSFHE